MNTIKCIFFWQGCVITEEFQSFVIRALQKKHHYFKKDSQINHIIKQDFEKLQLGLIETNEFCMRISESLNVSIEEDEIRNQIIDDVAIRPELRGVIDELKDNFDLWLISDFPVNLFNDILENTDISSMFLPNMTILSSQCHLSKIIPDLFFYAVNKSRNPMNKCMLADRNTVRAVKAVRYGLSSAIFVDVPRFRREFVLREMLQKSPIDYQAKTL